ncbi:MAG: hypothetical protein ACKVOE_09205 [Rickettsiales bacterium]
MDLTTEDFKAALLPQVARYSIRDRYEEISNALVNAMQECMGGPVVWDISSVKPRHLATVRAYYQKRSEQFGEIGEKILANEMNANAKIITAIARTYKIDIDFTKDLIDLDTVARMLSHTPAVRTTDYSGILEPVKGGSDRGFDPRRSEGQRTPQALLDAGSKRPTAQRRPHIIDVAASSKPVIESIPARPLGEIKAEYDRCWGDIAKVCEGKLPLVTLTNSESAAPWWRMDHAPFQQQLEGARTTAHDILHPMKADKLDGLFDRVATLHAEKEQARANGRGVG